MPAKPTPAPQGRLHAALRESIAQMKAGQTLDAAEAMAEYLPSRATTHNAPRSRDSSTAPPTSMGERTT